MLEDVQALPDDRGIAIDQAGISGLQYPIVVFDRSQGKQHTVAQVRAAVEVDQDVRGTHMSRLVEAVHEFAGDVRLGSMPAMLEELRRRLGSASAFIEFRFPHFLERRAPVTGARGVVGYESWLIGRTTGADEEILLGVRVPVTSLCPCSRAISDYGAHNQRAFVTIEAVVDPDEDLLWVDDLVRAAESSASAPIYPVLKRADERFVTMQAYDAPRFVEDMVRDALTQCADFPSVARVRIEAASEESIHDHRAFAVANWVRETESTETKP